MMSDSILLLLPWILALLMFGLWLWSERIRRIQNTKLTELIGKDSLTGLSNRRHFLDIAAREINRSQRFSNPLSALIIDVDDFNRSQRFSNPLSALIIDVDDLRHLNKTYGHMGGDLALNHVAQACRQSVRDFDLIARFSGEEIALLLPDTPLDGAIVVAERIRRKSAENRIAMPDGLEFTMTVCIGVAQTQNEMDSTEDLLLAADAALQSAMAAGPNKVMY
ncbi:MAG: GGDEF domain-containing protein [Proteobacteria bacterium]|nr:GGDEF domain-containing protein [Pseudomonadota bacterium]